MEQVPVPVQTIPEADQVPAVAAQAEETAVAAGTQPDINSSYIFMLIEDFCFGRSPLCIGNILAFKNYKIHNP